MTAPDAGAAILAGGRARRFGGRDKCRLVVEGRAIIVRQIDVLRRVAGRIVVIASDAERFTDLDVDVNAIEAGRMKAADLGATLRMTPLEEQELSTYGPVSRLLANLNTPEDLARVQ